MDRFRHVLLVQHPGGVSDQALASAVALCRRHDAQLKILSAVGPVPKIPGLSAAQMPEIDLRKLVLEEHRRELAALVERARREGVDATSRIRIGTPFVEIVREVVEFQHDLVVKTTGSAPSLSDRLFGTTALHLIRKCPCPVWILKTADTGCPRRILAPVDPSPDDDSLPAGDAHFRVNDTVLHLATDLARLNDAELVIVHAWSLYREGLLRGRSRLAPAQVDAMVRETERLHAAQLDELLASHDLSDLSSRRLMIQGEAGEVIPQVAAEERVDLIVMGSVGRTGLSGFFIGNTAETILQRVDCSVLTVKPDGFRTPVEVESAG